MRKLIHMTEKLDHMYSYRLQERRTNSNEIKEMYDLLNKAQTVMLTKKQLNCLQLYYYCGMTESEISKILGVNKSTVSRHLKAAREKLGLLYELV